MVRLQGWELLIAWHLADCKPVFRPARCEGCVAEHVLSIDVAVAVARAVAVVGPGDERAPDAVGDDRRVSFDGGVKVGGTANPRIARVCGELEAIGRPARGKG